MRKNFYLLVLSTLAGIISCQKEVDGILEERIEDDGVYLARLIMLDTTQQPGQDTLYQTEYFYDAQNRRVIDKYTDFDGDIWFYRYNYQGNDTLPFRVSEKMVGSLDSSNYYLKYTNGFITSDSTVGEFDLFSTVFHFSTLPGNRYQLRIVDYDRATNTPIPRDSTIYTRSVINGNWTSGLDSSWMLPSPAFLNSVTSSQFAFDNKPNPLTKLTQWYLGYYDNLQNLSYGTLNWGRNNVVSLTSATLFPPTPPETSNYSYSYLENGYPSVMRRNSIDGNKMVYVYR